MTENTSGAAVGETHTIRESLPASVYGLCHFLFAKLDAEGAAR